MAAYTKIITLVILFCAICCSVKAEQQRHTGIDAERIKRLDNTLSEHVKAGAYAGFAGLIMRHGHIAHKVTLGWQDKERHIPMRDDTIFRIYSMSKAMTSVAAMILYEEGHFQIDDPIHHHLPELKELRVYVSGEGKTLISEPLQRPITFRDLFTHTSGFVYHFMDDSPVHKLYRRHGIKPGTERLYARPDDAANSKDLNSMIQSLSKLPLLHQPGERMSYGVSIDVLGRLVEVISGQKLDSFMQQRIFTPLHMQDTGFVIPEHKLNRFAANYTDKNGQLVLFDDAHSSRYRQADRLLSGGAGLLSTTHDYMRFMQMILNGGKLEETRILGPKTIDFMLSNHFPKADMPRPAWMQQQGHGLGFALALNPVQMGMLTSENTADWAGAASTVFWIDRQEKLAAVFMTQKTPLAGGPLLNQIRSLSYQSLID